MATGYMNVSELLLKLYREERSRHLPGRTEKNTETSVEIAVFLAGI
jgi:hypothetical protein